MFHEINPSQINQDITKIKYISFFLWKMDFYISNYPITIICVLFENAMSNDNF